MNFSFSHTVLIIKAYISVIKYFTADMRNYPDNFIKFVKTRVGILNRFSSCDQHVTKR